MTTYAGMYLQHEALRLKLRDLQTSLADLRAAVDRLGSIDVEGRLVEVERAADSLFRQTS